MDHLFTVLSIKMIDLRTSRPKYKLFPTFLGKYGQFLMIFFLVGPYTDQFISSEVYIVQLFVRGGGIKPVPLEYFGEENLYLRKGVHIFTQKWVNFIFLGGNYSPKMQ